MFVAIILYTYWRKEIWTYEPVIPMLIGAAPGLALWYFSLRRMVVRNLKRELTQELPGQEEQKYQEKVVKTLIPPSQEALEQEKPDPIKFSSGQELVIWDNEEHSTMQIRDHSREDEHSGDMN